MNEENRASIGVIHLARCGNGLMPLEGFLKSYSDHSAGIGHDLVILLKGYDPGSAAEQSVQRLIKPFSAKTLAVPDVGFDLDAYRAAIDTFDYSYYCFLNSFSRISGDRWLEKMFNWASRPEIGIVGATGSYQSVFTDQIDSLTQALKSDLAKLRAGIQGVSEPNRVGKEPAASRHSGSRNQLDLTPHNLGRAVAFYVNVLCRAPRDFVHFSPFPNCHVRTNGFLLSRRVLNQIRWKGTSSKFDAYCFESGRRGLTAQILRLGLKPVIVGKDGRGYFRHEWHLSHSFWQGEQDNLLVEDNQTVQYKEGSLDERKRLSRFAWRELSFPSLGAR